VKLRHMDVSKNDVNKTELNLPRSDTRLLQRTTRLLY